MFDIYICEQTLVLSFEPLKLARIFDRDGSNARKLLANADLALYRAKSDGRSTYHFFESGMDAALQQRRTIEAGLRLAYHNHAFEFAEQDGRRKAIIAGQGTLGLEIIEQMGGKVLSPMPTRDQDFGIQPGGDLPLQRAELDFGDV